MTLIILAGEIKKMTSWYHTALKQVIDVIDHPEDYTKAELRTWSNRMLEIVEIINEDIDD